MKLTDRHPGAVIVGIFYGRTAVCYIETMQAILWPDPRMRIEVLKEFLSSELRRFDQMFEAKLE